MNYIRLFLNPDLHFCLNRDFHKSVNKFKKTNKVDFGTGWHDIRYINSNDSASHWIITMMRNKIKDSLRIGCW